MAKGGIWGRCCYAEREVPNAIETRSIRRKTKPKIRRGGSIDIMIHDYCNQRNKHIIGEHRRLLALEYELINYLRLLIINVTIVEVKEMCEGASKKVEKIAAPLVI